MDEQAGRTAEAKLSEALEYVNRARGHLYSFHQLVGHADFLLDEVIEAADKAGRPEISELVRSTLYGANVLSGRWSFEVVDDFDGNYYAAWRDVEEQVRQQLSGGKKHGYEARLKAERQAKGVSRETTGPR